MSPKAMKLLAKPMLFCSALIWGTSFFVMKTPWMRCRCFFCWPSGLPPGAILLALVCWRRWKAFTPDYLWRGAVMGGFLFLAYSVQTFGLALTTPSKMPF